jgi:hypothetical protein
VHSAKVADVLLALPTYWPVKVNKLLDRCGSRRPRRSAAWLTVQCNELAE